MTEGNTADLHSAEIGAVPIRSTKFKNRYGALAHLGERWFCKSEVAGAKPASSTIAFWVLFGLSRKAQLSPSSFFLLGFFIFIIRNYFIMEPKKTTAKTLKKRAEAFVEYILENHKDGNKEGVSFACEAFDDMLDTLHNEDFFGTEGQCDPRGDRRG